MSVKPPGQSSHRSLFDWINPMTAVRALTGIFRTNVADLQSQEASSLQGRVHRAEDDSDSSDHEQFYDCKELETSRTQVYHCPDGDDGVIAFHSVNGVEELFNESSRPYATTVFKNGHFEIGVAKTFLTDIERSGEPDEFYLDDQLIEAPKTDDQKQELLEKMLKAAGGDQSKVLDWTQRWNYRAKIAVQDSVIDEFRKQYALSPIFGRNDSFTSSMISLDTQTGIVKYTVTGDISNALDDSDPIKMPEIVPVQYSFKGTFEHNPNENFVKKTIEFKTPSKVS